MTNGKAKKGISGEGLHNSKGPAENAKGTSSGNTIVSRNNYYSLSEPVFGAEGEVSAVGGVRSSSF